MWVALMEHTQNIQQQITETWKLYVNCCLEHNADQAAAHMRRIDALLDCVPRPRQDCE